MIRLILILAIFYVPCVISAQDKDSLVLNLSSADDVTRDINLEQSSQSISPEMVTDIVLKDDVNFIDTLYQPKFDSLDYAPLGRYPMGFGNWYGWGLHEGLNLSIGLSAFSSFGHSPFKGMGFGQNIALEYVLPINNKLFVSLGGYFDNLFFSGDSYREAGINAVIGYRFDEHWEGYVYGQKSLVGNRMPIPYYDLSDFGDRIGAAIKYNFNPSISIQVSLETSKPRP